MNIGWKNRLSETKRFKQLKTNSIGGNVELELNASSQYSLSDIIEMVMNKYNSNTAVEIFKQSTVKLGFWNNEVIDSFSLPNGSECGIWDYYEYKNLPMSRMNLYFLTTLKENLLSNDDSDSDNDSLEENKNICTRKDSNSLNQADFSFMEKETPDNEFKKILKRIQVPFKNITNLPNVSYQQNYDSVSSSTIPLKNIEDGIQCKSTWTSDNEIGIKNDLLSTPSELKKNNEAVEALLSLSSKCINDQII